MRRGPRTVLFLHPSAGGYGADRQLEVLASGLDPCRYRPVVVLGEHGPLGDRLLAAGVDVRHAELPVLRRDLGHGRGAASLVAQAARAVREVGDLAAQLRAEVVHSNTTIVLCGGGVAARAGARHVQHVREIYEGATGGIAQALWPLLRGRIARADGLLCVSEAVARQFRAHAHARVVHDAVSRDVVAPARLAARRALDVAPASFAIAVVGRVSDWKGQAVLLRALARPPLADIGAVALIAGDAAPGQRHFEDELRALVRHHGLGARVRMLGFREDVETVLAAADVAALPATHPDALPGAAVEAALAGVPVVATAVGGQPEIVRDGETGRLVPAGDVAALASAVRDLADEPGGAARMAAAAAVAARARFGRDRLLEQVQAQYDRVCEPAGESVVHAPAARPAVVAAEPGT